MSIVMTLLLLLFVHDIIIDHQRLIECVSSGSSYLGT